MRIKKISITGVFVNPSTPMSDQDRISLYNINTIIGRQAMRIKKKQLDGYLLIQYQILRTNIARNYIADSREN